MDSKRVLVCGIDGFCGFPLALRLSSLGFEVCGVDNFVRRKIDVELNSTSLTPIKSIKERLECWKSLTGKEIGFHFMDLANDYDQFKNLLVSFNPTTIVHLAEQKSAPYSMKTSRNNRYTVSNNLNATNNILSAVCEVDPSIHVAHLGTTGYYGYGAIPDSVIPEGYVKVIMDGKETEILHPAYGGSIYHVTKTQDALLFQFYAKNNIKALFGVSIQMKH